jgi:hypothetical protein
MKSFPISANFAKILIDSGTVPEGWRVAEDVKSPRGWRLYSNLAGKPAKRAFNKLFFQHYEYNGMTSYESEKCPCCDYVGPRRGIWKPIVTKSSILRSMCEKNDIKVEECIIPAT